MNLPNLSGRVSRRIVNAGLAVVMTLAILPGITLAQNSVRPRAVDLLPQETALYLQIDDVQQLFTDFSDSNFGKMLKDEKIAPLVEQLYGEARKAFDKLDEEEELGFSLSDLASLPAGEFCFAVIAPRRDIPKFALVMDVPEDSDIAQRLITRVREEAEEDEGAEFETATLEDIEYQVIRNGGDDEDVYYVLHENTLVACNNESYFEDMMHRWIGDAPERDKTLAQNRKFITIMNKCKSTEDLPMALSFFVDPLQLARSATSKQAGARMFFAALPTLGLDGISGIGGSALFNEKNYESVFHGHLLLANPRAGIIEMIAMRPGFYDPEPFIPADVMTYMTSTWDFQKFMAELESIVDAFTEEGTFEKQIKENISDELGIDFQEDVLRNLKGRVSMVQWAGDKPTLDGQCNALIVQLDDVDRGTEFLNSVMDRMSDDVDEDDMPVEDTHEGVTYWYSPVSMQEQGRRARDRWRERQAEEDGREWNGREEPDGTRMEMIEFVPCFTIVEDSFILAGNVDMLKHLIETSEGDHDQLIDDAEFKNTIKEMRTLLDGNLPSLLTYTRPDRTLEMFYEVLNSENTRDVLYEGAEDNELMKVLSDLVEDNDLPPFEDLAKYFPPQGAFVVNDDTGFHFLAFSRKAKTEEDE